MTNHGTFCTVFDCMDGRCQELILEWTRKEFGTDYPDTITIAGCDGVMLAQTSERERAFTMARISAEKHGSTQAVVVGHSSCAGYPVPEEEHNKAIEEAVKIVGDSGIFKTVVGLFVDVDKKQITEVCRV